MALGKAGRVVATRVVATRVVATRAVAGRWVAVAGALGGGEPTRSWG